ncbi:MAG: hypothetical protein IJY63_04545 [Clostridia bacterium]|nr:hypothetical protein [Clostridia bacterium]
MKTKKWLTLTAAIGLTFGVMAFTACGGKGDNGNSASPDPQICTLTIVDQDGDKVEGVTFDVLQGETTVATLETDENGVATVDAILPGEYSVRYTEFPSTFYDVDPETAGIPIVTRFTVSDTAAVVTLVVSNWDFGTSLNPYTCYYGTDEETGEPHDTMTVPTVKANSDNYYVISRSADRILCIGQADVTILYSGTFIDTDGQTKTFDETHSAADGAIEIQLHGKAGDFYDWAKIQIVNETDADIELVMTMKDVAVEEGDESTEEAV